MSTSNPEPVAVLEVAQHSGEGFTIQPAGKPGTSRFSPLGLFLHLQIRDNNRNAFIGLCGELKEWCL